MAAPTVKEILLKWGIDNSNWKKAISELAQLLEKTNKDAIKAQDAAVKKLDAQKVKLKEIIADRKSETEQIEKQISSLKVKAAAANAEKASSAAKLATERAASGEAAKQGVLQRNLLLTQKTLQQEVYTKLMNERLVTAEINRQTAALRQQAAAARLGGPGGPGGGGPRGPRPPTAGGGAGGILGGIGKAVLGLSPLGSTIFAATTAAEAFVHVVEQAIEKLKELSTEVGPLQEVREQFEKLAVGRGVQDPAGFINKLRDATHGLVGDLQLYKTANTFFQSSVHASESDVIKLTQATVGLARAQGKGAAEGMQALTQYFLTGYPRALSKILGVNRAYLTQTGQMSRGLDQLGKQQLSFNQLLEVATKQYRAVGEPAQTYADVLTKLGNATKRVAEEFVIGFEQSKGFQSFIAWIDQLADKVGGLVESAAKFGEQLGNVFTILAEAGKLVLSIFGLLNSAVEGIFSLLPSVFDSQSTVSDDFISRLTTVKGLFITIAQTLILLRGAMDEFALRTEYTMKEAAVSAKEAWKWANTPNFGIGGYDSAKVKAEQARLHQEFEEKISGQSSKEYQDLVAMQGAFGGQGKDDFKVKFAMPAPLYTAEMAAAAARKIAKSKEQIAIEESKAELEIVKMRIAQEEELVKMEYDQGLMTHKEYLEKKGQLDKVEHEAKLKQLDDEYKAKAQFNRIDSASARLVAEQQRLQAEETFKTKTDALAKETAEKTKNINESTTITSDQKKKALEDVATANAFWTAQIAEGKAVALKMAKAITAELDAKQKVDDITSDVERLKEDSGYLSKKRALTEEAINDEIAARQKLVDAEKKLDETRLATSKASLEKDFQEGLVSSNKYLAARVDIINKEYEVTKRSAQTKLDQNKITLVTQAEFDSTMINAAAKREKEITQLADTEWDIRVNAAKAAADRISGVLQSQLDYLREVEALNPFSEGTKSTQVTTLNTLINLEEKRLKVLMAESEQTDGLYGTNVKIQEEISKTQQTILKYNQELIKARDYSQDLANQARSMSTAASLFPRGGRTAEGFNQFAQITETVSKLRQEFQNRMLVAGGAKPKARTPEELFAAFDEEAKKASTITVNAAQESADALKKWIDTGDSAQKTLSDNIVSLTELYRSQSGSLQDLNGATKEVIKSFDDLAAKAGGKRPGKGFYGGASARPFSGQSTAAYPGGVPTDSDLQAMEDQMRSHPAGSDAAGMPPALAGVASTATAATTSLAKFNQSILGQTLGENGLVGFFQNLGKNADKAGEDLGNFASGVTAIAGTIGAAYQALHTAGAWQGAAAGAAAGGQIGAMIPIPGAQLIGTAIGAVVGAISGAMREATMKMAERMSAAFKAVINEVQNGTQTLAAGITLSIGNIQQAVLQLHQSSGNWFTKIFSPILSALGLFSNGAKDALKAILPDMEAQLQQLQAQQAQVLNSMDAQLNVLNAPDAFQQQLTSINAIIASYRQYIQAGGDITNANQFLQDSFTNLSREGFATLNQDEQDAINNALNYNNLLLQRQELIQSTNQQIQDIMSQGVAVRQMPEGVTKARQIQQVMLNAQNQLDQMDQEIAVANHKLQAEQQIFKLATTRIGLETQLVGLQNQQTDLSMQQIVALGTVVGGLQKKLPTSVQGALQEFGLGTAYVSPGTEPGLIPVPPVKTGQANLDLMNQMQYQQELQAWQLAQDQPIGYIPPSGLVSTTPVPTVIGSPTPYKGGSLNATIPQQTWLTPTYQAPTAFAQTPTSLNTLLGGIPAGASPAETLAALTGSAIPSATGPTAVVSGLTANNEQVDTVSTSQGTALLVSASVPTGGPTAQFAPGIGPRPPGGGTPGSPSPVGLLPKPVVPGYGPQAATPSGWVSPGTAALPYGALPSDILTPVQVPAGPGSTQNTGIIGTFQQVLNAYTGSGLDVLVKNVAAQVAPAIASKTYVGTPAIASAAVDSQISAAKLGVEKQINTLSNTRVAQETQLVNLKMQEIAADMQRIQAHSTLLAAYKSKSTTTLEDLMQTTYETRGRQGFGRFYGEIANPT